MSQIGTGLPGGGQQGDGTPDIVGTPGGNFDNPTPTDITEERGPTLLMSSTRDRDDEFNTGQPYLLPALRPLQRYSRYKSGVVSPRFNDLLDLRSDGIIAEPRGDTNYIFQTGVWEKWQTIMFFTREVEDNEFAWVYYDMISGNDNWLDFNYDSLGWTGQAGYIYNRDGSRAAIFGPLGWTGSFNNGEGGPRWGCSFDRGNPPYEKPHPDISGSNYNESDLSSTPARNFELRRMLAVRVAGRVRPNGNTADPVAGGVQVKALQAEDPSRWNGQNPMARGQFLKCIGQHATAVVGNRRRYLRQSRSNLAIAGWRAPEGQAYGSGSTGRIVLNSRYTFERSYKVIRDPSLSAILAFEIFHLWLRLHPSVWERLGFNKYGFGNPSPLFTAYKKGYRESSTPGRPDINWSAPNYHVSREWPMHRWIKIGIATGRGILETDSQFYGGRSDGLLSTRNRNPNGRWTMDLNFDDLLGANALITDATYSTSLNWVSTAGWPQAASYSYLFAVPPTPGGLGSGQLHDWVKFDRVILTHTAGCDQFWNGSQPGGGGTPIPNDPIGIYRTQAGVENVSTSLTFVDVDDDP